MNSKNTYEHVSKYRLFKPRWVLFNIESSQLVEYEHGILFYHPSQPIVVPFGNIDDLTPDLTDLLEVTPRLQKPESIKGPQMYLLCEPLE